jgi:hypothetical protein
MFCGLDDKFRFYYSVLWHSDLIMLCGAYLFLFRIALTYTVTSFA